MVLRRQNRLILAVILSILVVLTCNAMGKAEAKQTGFIGGWQRGPDAYNPNRVIVRFSDAVTKDAAVSAIQQLGFSVYRTADFKPTPSFPNGLRIGIIELPEGVTPDSAISKLSVSPGILYAEKDYIYYKVQMPTDTPVFPNDPEFHKMWALHNESCQYIDPVMPGDPVDDADIDAPEAWAIHTGSDQMLAAIIDTGCYAFHPDLEPNIWVNPDEIPGNGIDDDGNGYIDDIWGWDFYHSDNSVWHPDERDIYGNLNDAHGTHTSGILGARGNNDMGVTGVNWNIKVMVLKFLGPSGGYSSDAILAFNYAADKGVRVINCSWGGGPFSQAMKDAIEATGAIVCCAAGNDGDNTDLYPHYPSSYDSENIISVAAMMQNDTPVDYPDWWSTNYGPESVDLYAPGGFVLNTVPPDPPPTVPTADYDFYYGTSMSAPHVSGVAALIHSLRPDIPLYRGAAGWVDGMPTVKELILSAVDVKPVYEGTCVAGGRLNAASALLGLSGPAITHIDAQPRSGQPPLEVTFTASAIVIGGEILDKWWDFGDGSDPVHEFEAVHTYEELGDYTATFHAVDNEGQEATASVLIKVFFPPEISVEPDEIHVDLWWGEEETHEITVSNTGQGDLEYSVNIRLVGKVDASGEAETKLGQGGPDDFGYLWIDTDEPGMEPPEWKDIRSIGTRVSLSDDSGVEVDLPFEFPFYGEKKSKIAICSNGYLTFGEGLTAWNNTTIPNTAQPNDLLAAFWDDLTLSSSGECHYYGDEEVFIVQYTEVPRLSSGGPYTFQVRLTPQGIITYQYLTMQGTRLNEATIGIENSDGTIGLQVAYNEHYIHDDMAIMFIREWLVSSSTGGTVAPGETDTFELTFYAHNLPKGTWKAVVEIESNDPLNPKVEVDTSMFVRSVIPPVIRSVTADPWAGSAPLEVRFSVDTYDPDGTVADIIWDFDDGTPPVSGVTDTVHTYTEEGEYTAQVKVTDDDGFETIEEVTIVVRDLPKADVNPVSFNRAIRAHREVTETLTVTNVGLATLEFEAAAYTAGIPSKSAELQPLGAGGPDSFGYAWRDSDEPGGPTFDWFEISEIGTKLEGLGGEDSRVVDLPFEFPFYGDMKTEIRIAADGYITFGPSGNVYTNVSIPNTGEPNDLMAVYWDDLNPPQAPSGGGVFYYYDEANSRFIVQWNKIPRYYNTGLYTFQAILYPDGGILYQYRDMQFGSTTYAADGTIGIENATGTEGLQVLHNTAGYMHNNLAIKIEPVSWMEVVPTTGQLEPGESLDLDVTFNLGRVGSGTLEGAVVLDTNDLLEPRTIVPVRIQVLPNSPPEITACGVNPQQRPPGTAFQFVAAAHDPDGLIADKYWSFGDGTPAVHEFVADHVYETAGSYTATFTVVDNDGYTATAKVEVLVAEAASASWSPEQFDFTLGCGVTATDVLTLYNAGPGTLLFGSGEFPSMVQMPKRMVLPGDIKDPEARTAEGLYAPVENPVKSEWLPDAVGSVIIQWTCPPPIGDPWGVGVLFDSDEVVIADGAVDPTDDYVVTREGVYTGKWWSADFGGSWSADMAFDGTYIWQVNVGGDNAIYKIDPANGQTVGSIYNSAWGATSQRGLAYNANDDTFYIGGWNEDIIYKIKGESWDNPGQVIEQWSMPVSIAGLAYHPGADILIVSANSSPDMIYLVNATTHATIAQFQHPAGGDYMGVGCELAHCGNLWVASWGENKMYLVETGLGPIGVDWLSWEPREGSVPAGGQVPITVTVNTEKLNAGTHQGNVVLTTNDINNPLVVVPVTVQVAQPPVITEASAEPTFGEPPLEVTFRAAFDAPEIPVVSFGWDFGDGESSAELDVVHTYASPGTYIATFEVADEMGATAKVDFEIEVRWLPHATVEPEEIELTLSPVAVATEIVTIGNLEGNAGLTFEVKVRGGKAPIVAMPERVGIVKDELALTAEGLYSPIDPELVEKMASSVKPNAVGDVVTSWRVPSEISIPWGVGFSGDVWIADPEYLRDHIVTTQGIHTGTIFDTPWAGDWPGDMAYDSNRDLMWQVNVGGDNGIYGLHPETGQVVMSITSGGPWTYISQRGLAYDANTDTFYIGGWNEDIIYHIMGPSWSTPGAVIDAWSFPVGIAGLAWHPDGILWVSTNSDPDMIYGLDLEALEIVHQFPHPFGSSYSGAGLALNSDGNLWASSMDNLYMYLINTEMPLTQGIVVEPQHGTVPQGETDELEVTINAAELGEPGSDVTQYLEIKTNDPMNPFLYVNLIIHIEAGPTIIEATATPEIGQPPLTVTFRATVEPGAVPITDLWWDFGDGSDPVHETDTVHTYTELGEYTASFHAVDENGVEVAEEITITVKWLPSLEVTPDEFDEVVSVGEEKQYFLTVSNTGVAPMEFQISVSPSFAGSPEWLEYAAKEHIKGDFASEPLGYAGAGAGGPDGFGYVWIDSNHDGGPVFDWVEISGVGTRLSLSDESIVEVDLPFPFPFYGDVKTKVRVCSNGYLTFATGSSVWTNTPIPDPSNPNDLIAVFWDDLNPTTGGNVYYYHDQEANRFIVEYQTVRRYSGTGDYTFQAILYPNGTIVYQFLEMTGDLNSATVGIENADGTDGLQVVYNAPYIEDGLAIGFAPIGTILRVNPTSGYLVPGGHQDVVLTMGAPDAPYGTYSLYLYVSANDPYRPFVAIPVKIKINAAPSIEITAPVGGEELHGVYEIEWTAQDPDDDSADLLIDLAWTRDGIEWHEIGSGFANTGSFEWNTIEVGESGETFRIWAKATDPSGSFTEFVTDEFAIINIAPPQAAFSFAPSPATVDDVVKFTDESTDDGEIVEWHWEFGDGSESSLQNPEHRYTAKGEFKIRLTVTDNDGLQDTAEDTILIVNLPPEVEIIRPEVGEVLTGEVTVQWQAVDPDNDASELKINLECRLAGSEDWQTLASGLDNTGEFLWDTSKLERGGRYVLRVTAVDPDGARGEAISDVFTVIVLAHTIVAAPNPASDSVTFYYDIATDGTLYVYDIVGRLVHSAQLPATMHIYEWNLESGGKPVANGIYLYFAVTGSDKSEVGRLVVNR
ncbi:MAG TPA: PKD domain-containing protein [Bacillota bacterium]|jgi:PKD repeat protein|nr:PKD domain-containing protein [Bacillota bacterium]